MTARTAYGLDTQRGTHWADRAACSRANGAVDPEWWWPPQGASDADTLRALHICRTHCPVRHRCARDAVDNPPRHPSVQGGRRYVLLSGGSGRVAASKVVEQGSSHGCPYCAAAEVTGW